MKKVGKQGIQVKKNKIKYRALFLVSFVLLTIFAVQFFVIFKVRKSDDFSKYTEKGCASYAVNLKDNYNPYGGDVPTSNMQYLSSKLNGFNANLYYRLDMKKHDIEYKYTYTLKQISEVVSSETGKTIIKNEEVIKTVVVNSFRGEELFISESYYVDYAQHDQKITYFINEQSDLRRHPVVCTLKVVLEINLKGVCQDFEESLSKNPQVYVSVPLTTDTVSVTTGNNIIKGTGEIILCKNLSNDTPFLVFGIIFTCMAAGMFVVWYLYGKFNQTQDSRFARAVNKIESTYGSYIQTITNEISSNYEQVVEFAKFRDLLEVSNIIKQPVFVEKKTDDETVYVVPESTTRIYVHRIKKSDFAKLNDKDDFDDDPTDPDGTDGSDKSNKNTEESVDFIKPKVINIPGRADVLKQTDVSNEKIDSKQKNEAISVGADVAFQKKSLDDELRREQERKIAEEKRLEQEKKLAEKNRLAEEKRIAKEKRLSEKKRLMEERRVLKEQREQEKKRLADEKRLEKNNIMADEKLSKEHKLVEARLRDKEKKIEQEHKLAEKWRLAEEKRLADERKSVEKMRQAEEKRLINERKLAEKKRLAEERRLIQEKKLIEQRRLAEEKKIVQEKKLDEKRRLTDEKKLANERRQVEKLRQAEEKKLMQEKKLAEKKQLAEERKLERSAKEPKEDKIIKEKPEKKLRFLAKDKSKVESSSESVQTNSAVVKPLEPSKTISPITLAANQSNETNSTNSVEQTSSAVNKVSETSYGPSGTSIVINRMVDSKPSVGASAETNKPVQSQQVYGASTVETKKPTMQTTYGPSGSSVVINKMVNSNAGPPTNFSDVKKVSEPSAQNTSGSSVVINMSNDQNKPNASGSSVVINMTIDSGKVETPVQTSKPAPRTTYGPSGSSVVITKNVDKNTAGASNFVHQKPIEPSRPTLVNVLPTKSQMLDEEKVMPLPNDDSMLNKPEEEQRKKFRQNVINVPIRSDLVDNSN